MKAIKNIIYVVCVLFISSCSSVSIIQDYIGEDDTRHIRTKSETFYLSTDNRDVKYKLSVGAVHKYDTSWYFIISSDEIIPSPADILFKLDNDSIIHLHCNKVYEDTTKIYTSKAETKSVTINTGLISSTSSNSAVIVRDNPDLRIYYSALFDISARDFSLLNKYMVVKMRILAKDEYSRILFIDGKPICPFSSYSSNRKGNFSFSINIQKRFSKIIECIKTSVPPRKQLYDEF